MFFHRMPIVRAFATFPLALALALGVSGAAPLPPDPRNGASAPVAPAPAAPPPVRAAPTISDIRPPALPPCRPACATPPPPPTQYVQAYGSAFRLAGRPFHFVGMNWSPTTVYSPYQGCGDSFRDADVEEGFRQLQAASITVIRAWVMRPYMTLNGAYNFARMDYILQRAAAHNVHVVAVLGNGWGACDDNLFHDADWFQSGYTASYRPFALDMARRYAGNAALLSWELVSEPQARDGNWACAPGQVYHFAQDMAAAIRAVDANHLITLGALDGCVGNQTADRDYDRIFALMDYAVDDDYSRPNDAEQDVPWTGNPTRSLHRDLRDVVDTLRKPYIVNEGGDKVRACDMANDPECMTTQHRADILDWHIRVQYGDGESGYIAWGFNPVPARNPLGDGDFAPDDPFYGKSRAFMAQYP